ncbi:hypothetical protein D9M70_430140 [compost metagenome]
MPRWSPSTARYWSTRTTPSCGPPRRCPGWLAAAWRRHLAWTRTRSNCASNPSAVPSGAGSKSISSARRPPSRRSARACRCRRSGRAPRICGMTSTVRPACRASRPGSTGTATSSPCAVCRPASQCWRAPRNATSACPTSSCRGWTSPPLKGLSTRPMTGRGFGWGTGPWISPSPWATGARWGIRTTRSLWRALSTSWRWRSARIRSTTA